MPPATPRPATPDPAALAAYVEAMAAALGLPLPEEIQPGVVAQVVHIWAIAEPLLTFPLPDTLESAATFEP